MLQLFYYKIKLQKIQITSFYIEPVFKIVTESLLENTIRIVFFPLNSYLGFMN